MVFVSLNYLVAWLTQLTVQYPDQLPLEAWSSAFTALPQDVYAITEEHLSFAGALEEDPILLIAGFECADLSPAGSRKGLQGSKSSTFYPLLSVLASLQRMRSSYAFPLANLIENTASQFAYGSSRAMKDSFHELCAKIGPPVVLDAANVGSYAHRLRNYWTNLVSSSALQCILDSFERDPDLNLSDVLYTTNPQICTKTRSYPWCTANVPGKLLKVLPTLVARVDSYAFRSRPDGEGQGQVLNEEGNLVPLTLEERERILGYPTVPTGSTDIPAISFHARHHILGSCFDAFAVSHLIACAFALRFSMVLPDDDTYPSSHISELGGGQLTFDLPDDLLSVVLSGREFLSLAAQHLAVERQESSTSTDPDIWMDDHTLAFLHHPDMDLSMHSDAERKRRILRRASSYVMTGKLLYRKMPDGNLKVVPEPSLRLEIAKKLHEDNGHFGRRRTTALTMLRYWWNGLWDDCSTVIKACQACSCTKVSFNSQSPVLHPLPIRGLMYRWSLDTAGPFEPTSRGHTRVLRISHLLSHTTTDHSTTRHMGMSRVFTFIRGYGASYQDALGHGSVLPGRQARAKEFRPTSGPRHKQRGRPRNIAIPATVTPPNAPALLLKRGPGRPKKFPTAMVALMPTYKWSYPRAVEQGLPDLLPGIADPAFSKHISSFSPGGNRFKQHFSPVSAAELSTLLHLLDDSYSHSILDITHGAAAGVILHLPTSESFSITTNEYLCDIPADFHLDLLDPMQPESYTLIKEHHSMHVIIVCPALPLADILIPLTSIYAQHVACCLISKKYFLNSYYSRYAWLISLRAKDRLFIIPSDSNGATDNVWMLIFSSSGVKHSILRDSKDQLTGILLASSEYVLTS
ncbi:hypothetical protein CEUSTIGMA_g11513.t1 [Chlamydomonas eustigma]|uniref:Integrase zinc-binding domain-containing protein n=1 Tax=Chlamydomonas eustigma TaxID=1157962 RepID=A0A250XME1_9CHLO|nr:hypothetical protein CEUSTIGMA_g11513.t1 [Chlamydomonas eustigma]|eukprot:GAX84089.1 hypothetical protein CEUSTIGMA_g11513.t1 [Chlamydomonas eustigma]